VIQHEISIIYFLNRHLTNIQEEKSHLSRCTGNCN